MTRRASTIGLVAGALALTSCSVTADPAVESFTPAPAETVYVTVTPTPVESAEVTDNIEDQVAYTKAVMFSTTLTYEDIGPDDLLEWGEGSCGHEASDYRMMLTLTQDFTPEQADAIIAEAARYLCI